jgi:hypothetical protein
VGSDCRKEGRMNKSWEEIGNELHEEFGIIALSVINALHIPQFMDWLVKKVEEMNK